MTLLILLCKVQVLLVRGLGGIQSCKFEEILLITVALLMSSTLREGFPTTGTEETPENRVKGDKMGGETMKEERKRRGRSC